jgi:hypothetical protein
LFWSPDYSFFFFTNVVDIFYAEDYMRKSLILVILALLLLIPSLVFAVSEAAVIFLLIEPSSRSGAMGQAHVAQVDDAFAGYWNTGAMAFNRSTQIAFMHTNWFGEVFTDIYYEYLAANMYFEDTGNLGLSFVYATYGKQQMIDEDGNYIKEFSSWDFSPALTYGYQVSKNIGVGGAFKYIHSDLAPEGTGQTETNTKGQGKSFAFDFGYLQKDILPIIPMGRLDFGFNIQNFGPNITYINEEQSDPLPLNFRMGFSWKVFDQELSRLTLNADMNKLLANRNHEWYTRIIRDWYDQSLNDEWEEVILGAGAEYTYLNLLSLRGGYLLDRTGSIEGFSFGGGVFYNYEDHFRIDVDFAMQPGGDLQDYNKTFSLKVSL